MIKHPPMTNSPTLKTPIAEMSGVGEQTEKQFKRLGIQTVGDIFELLPFRFEDRTTVSPIKDLEPEKEIVIAGQVKSVSSRTSKRGAFIVQAIIEDESGKIPAVWFNQKYLLKTLRAGVHVLLYGTKRIVPVMNNPFFVKKIIPRLEVAPIYPATSGLSQYIITRLLERSRPLLGAMKDVIPAEALETLGLPSRRLALDAAHFSPSQENIDQARKLLGAEELLTLCIQAIVSKKKRLQIQVEPLSFSEETVTKLIKSFDFDLTKGQQVALDQILSDLKKPYPMNRLMYGEVGSGKTAIGLIIAGLVAKGGKKTVWLSPTTNLAHQQKVVAQKFCESHGLRSALITGSVKEDAQDADLIVGTHALLNKKLEINDVGLVIIDEQHRFGVDQRESLITKHGAPHLLMMTATPIPRSLSHTLFGHLDITFLLGKPTHQKPVKTYVFTEVSRHKIETNIGQRLAQKQPGYVVCPLIDPADDGTLFDGDRKAVMTEKKRLQEIFPNARIGLLHGRLKNEEKEEVMDAFRQGQYDILLSTSVIEVGIDNPEATWIMIEEADRFGLSQLHQLRGRVGRGEKESVCFLHNSVSTEHATERLKALSETYDGLEIAETDLRLRGPGNIAGNQQSGGLPSLRYADLSNIEEIKRTYLAAEKLVDDGLGKYPALKNRVNKLVP